LITRIISKFAILISMALLFAQTGSVFAQTQTFGITTVGLTSYSTTFGNTATGSGAVSGNYLVVDQYTLNQPLIVTQIHTYGIVSGTVKVSIYSDASGYPGTLLFTEVASAVTQNSWSSIIIPNTYLPAGAYWIAFDLNKTGASANIITLSNNVTGAVRKMQPWQYTTAFPNNPAPASWADAAVGNEDCTYLTGTTPILGYSKATQATIPPTISAVIQSMSYYSNTTGDFRLAIYSDAGGPSLLQWSSGSIKANPSASWNTILISSGTPTSLTLASGTYWLAWQSDDNAGPSYMTGSSSTGDYIAQPYGTYPSTWSSGTLSNENWSLYGSYKIITTTTAAAAAICQGSSSVNLTVTVAPNPGGGTVQFYIDGSTVGSASVTATTGIATLAYNPSALSAGTHIIRGDFSGYLSFLPSSSNPGNNATLTIYALPTPTITGPTPVCINSTGNVYSTVSGMTNYIWAVSAGGTITAGGGSANNTVTVTITVTPANTAGTPSSTPTLCINTALTNP
jgi:hypothetical protein